MKNEPNDTWELAKQLESIAKLLKKAPRFILTKQVKDAVLTIDDTKEFQIYSKLTVKKLRVLCKDRGIKIPSRSRKADIVKLLEEYDSGIKTIDKIAIAFNQK